MRTDMLDYGDLNECLNATFFSVDNTVIYRDFMIRMYNSIFFFCFSLNLAYFAPIPSTFN